MTEQTPDKPGIHGDLLRMTSDVAAAYLARNDVSAQQIPQLIQTIYGSLSSIGSKDMEPKQEPLKPAVQIRKSVTPDYIICLEDGKKLKMLKRHLRTMYNMTPDEYRQKWGLPADYPMVAPNYAAARSEFAKQIGLGRTAPPEAANAPRRGRKSAASA